MVENFKILERSESPSSIHSDSWYTVQLECLQYFGHHHRYKNIHQHPNLEIRVAKSYLAQSAIVLAVNAQASLSRVRRNNIAKEIYGSEVHLPIKIKDTPKMFDETETEHVRKLAKSIRKNNEAKQSLLKLNYHSKPNTNAKKSVNSSGNNTTGNSSNSKSSSASNGRSNNFNGSPSNVASGSNNTKSANGTNNRFQKNKK
ncbi:hypothetical protein ACTFIR_003775 [Dictyostelium discoideum]